MDPCERSHVVSLHKPALPATEGLVGSAELQAMRDDAVFINTARGMCVDEQALVEELSKGRLFAFLDVTHPEPARQDSRLRSLANVVLTSHTAGPQAVNLGAQAVDDVERFLRGQEPVGIARPELFDRLA